MMVLTSKKLAVGAVAVVLAAGSATSMAWAATSAASTSAAVVGVSKDYKTIPAGTYTLDPSHASLHWSVMHMGLSNYTGRFDDLQGTLTYNPAKPTASSVRIVVDIDDVDTNNDKLEEHIAAADILDAKKYPTAVFEGNKLTMTGADTGKIAGKLTLRGVTKPMTMDVLFHGLGKNFSQQPTVGFSATGVINRSDYGVTFMPNVVGDLVTLRFEGEFNLVTVAE